MAINLGEPPKIEPEAVRCVEFQADDPKAFAKSVNLIGKLVDKACFTVKDSQTVALREMDDSHVALIEFELIPKELKEGDKLCLSIEKLNRVLGRARRDDEAVRLSCREDKAVVKFPDTEREFTIERVDMEPSELPEPKMSFDAKATVRTKELKDDLRDVSGADSVRLSADDGVVLSAEYDSERYSKRFRRGDINMLEYEAREPSTAQYPRDYLNDLITTDFDTATLRWSKDAPVEVSYQPTPESKLKFLLAPRIG